MTVIAAIYEGDTVTMGCDSRVSFGGGFGDVGESKILRSDKMLIGFCGWSRTKQLVEYVVELPQTPVNLNPQTAMRFLINDFIPPLRSCFESAGNVRPVHVCR